MPMAPSMASNVSGARASWTAAALCRFGFAGLAEEERQRAAAVQDLADSCHRLSEKPRPTVVLLASTQPVNLNVALNAAVSAARAAGQLMRRNLLSAKKVNAATSHDIKLELDVRCQKLIERKLHSAFPRIAFLGEEGAAGATNAEFRWVVDPIDGTVNYAHGLPHAGVSIALQRKVSGARGQVSGEAFETIMGVVYDPFQVELWTAIEGGVSRMNGKAIRVSGCRWLKDSIVSIGFAKSRSSIQLGLPYFGWLTRRVRKVRVLGSAALSLTYVATGRLDAYIETGVNVWDIAAGGFIIERAGGKFWTQSLDGRHRYRMIASNGLLHRQFPVPK
jgi:myo-inositol-1(or 4)-monophosphatase